MNRRRHEPVYIAATPAPALEPPALVLARLETRHFSFMCIAVSEDMARTRMEAAWDFHRTQMGAAMTWDEVAGDVNYERRELDRVYRDDWRVPF